MNLTIAQIEKHLPNDIFVSEITNIEHLNGRNFVGVFPNPHLINGEEMQTAFSICFNEDSLANLDDEAIKHRVDIAYQQGLKNENKMRQIN